MPTQQEPAAKTSNRAAIAFAVLALAIGVFTGTKAIGYGTPSGFALLVAVTTFSALYFSLDHLWSAWLRAKAATGTHRQGGDR